MYTIIISYDIAESVDTLYLTLIPKNNLQFKIEHRMMIEYSR